MLDAIATLMPSPPDTLVEITPLKVEWFIHIDPTTLHPISASTKESPCCIKVENNFGEKIASGEDSLFRYEVVKLRNETYELIEKSSVQKILDRVDVVKTIYELEEGNNPIQMEIVDDIVEIHYDGNLVQQGSCKFYFTRFDDPSYLKCTFQLDVNTLNEITLVNQLSEWPNPIRLKVENVLDLTIFGIKGQTPASIRYGKTSHQ